MTIDFNEDSGPLPRIIGAPQDNVIPIRPAAELGAAAAPEPQHLSAARSVIDIDAPYQTAREFGQLHFTYDDRRTLYRHRGTFYRWEGGAYSEIGEPALRSDLYAWLDQCDSYKGASRDVRPVKPDQRLVNDVLDGLRSAAHLDDAFSAPIWLSGGDGVSADEIIVCQNGLLHLPTRTLLPPTPLFFAHNAISFGFDPDAPAPEQWLAFLQQLWPDDEIAVETLQELFGYILTCDTRQQKAFWMVGPKRSGKGTIARVLTRLVGEANVVGPTLASLAGQFGLAPLIGKQLAIISDARLSARTDQAIVTERVLAITGEDTISPDRKHRDPWTGKLPTRLLFLSNELPRLSDSSGALASRFILFKLTQSFYGREDQHLTDRLVTELPGILNWALAGWDRLNERGHFRQPPSSLDAIADLEELSSPIQAFCRERTNIGTGYATLVSDLFTEWQNWCAERGRDPGNAHVFGRMLKSAVAGLETRQRRIGAKLVREFRGIRIKPEDP